MDNNEYLVRKSEGNHWVIAQPGATIGMVEEQCSTCQGNGEIEYKEGNDITGTRKIRPCDRCKGQGRVYRSDPNVIKLCWKDRNGAFICYAGEEDMVARLPD